MSWEMLYIQYCSGTSFKSMRKGKLLKSCKTLKNSGAPKMCCYSTALTTTKIDQSTHIQSFYHTPLHRLDHVRSLSCCTWFPFIISSLKVKNLRAIWDSVHPFNSCLLNKIEALVKRNNIFIDKSNRYFQLGCQIFL